MCVNCIFTAPDKESRRQSFGRPYPAESCRSTVVTNLESGSGLYMRLAQTALLYLQTHPATPQNLQPSLGIPCQQRVSIHSGCRMDRQQPVNGVRCATPGLPQHCRHHLASAKSSDPPALLLLPTPSSLADLCECASGCCMRLAWCTPE